MYIIKAANLALAFGVELAMLAALSSWAMGLSQENGWRWPIVLLVLGATVVMWAVLAAPSSTTRLSEPWLSVFKIALFTSTALALLQTGHSFWALVFAVTAAANLGLAAIWGQL